MPCVLRAKSTDFHSLSCTANCFWPNAPPSALASGSATPLYIGRSLDETTWCGGVAAAGVSRVVAARRAGVCTKAMPSQARHVLSCRDARPSQRSRSATRCRLLLARLRTFCSASSAPVFWIGRLFVCVFLCLFVCLFLCSAGFLSDGSTFEALSSSECPSHSVPAMALPPRPLSRRRHKSGLNASRSVGAARGCDRSPNARRCTSVELAIDIA